jgi:hypothetical protein
MVQAPGPFDVCGSPVRVFTITNDIEVTGDCPKSQMQIGW